MARYDHLPIWKDAVALTALLEDVVRRLMQTILVCTLRATSGCPNSLQANLSPATTNTPWARICAARRMPSVAAWWWPMANGTGGRVFHPLG